MYQCCDFYAYDFLVFPEMTTFILYSNDLYFFTLFVFMHFISFCILFALFIYMDFALSSQDFKHVFFFFLFCVCVCAHVCVCTVTISFSPGQH